MKRVVEYCDTPGGPRRFGMGVPKAKLTPHDVELIRSLRAEGMSLKVLADKFEVTTATVWSIVTNRTWVSYPTSWAVIDEKGKKRRIK